MRYLLILATLVGCTTTGEIREHEPRASYVSAKGIPALSECFLLNIGRGQPSVVKGETETLMTWGTAMATGLLVTMKPGQSGTAVEVRELVGYGARKAVERCI